MEDDQKTVAAAVAEVKRSNEEMAALITKQAAEIKATGETSAATAAAFKAAEQRYDQAHVDLKGLLEAEAKSRGDEVKALKERIDEMERQSQRGGTGWSTEQAEALKTVGEQFVDFLQSDAVQADFGPLKAGAKRGMSSGLAVKGFGATPSFRGYAPGSLKGASPEVLKALVASTDAPVQSIRLPGFVEIPRRRLTLRDLIRVRPWSQPSVPYLEEVGFFSVATTAVTSITRSSQTATVTTTSAHGYRTFDRIKIDGANQAEYNGVHRITVTGATTFTYTVTGSPATPATGTITANRMNNFGAAAGVAEGGVKPETGLKLEEKTVPVQVIAHHTNASRQILDDFVGLRDRIDDLLLYGLGIVEERYGLYGTGVSPQVQGIMSHPNVQTYKWSAGKTGDNKMDAIRRAMTRVEIAELAATGGIVHPLDFEDIETAKGSDNHYIWAMAPGAGGSTTVWRLPLVVTTAIDQGDFCVGAFATAAALYDRQTANILFSDSHASNFTSNILTILAEERIAYVWERPEAFVAGEFDAEPA